MPTSRAPSRLTAVARSAFPARVNVKNAHLSGIKVTGFAGPLLSTANVTGTGLEGAVKIAAPAAPPQELLAAPATPYQLH